MRDFRNLYLHKQLFKNGIDLGELGVNKAALQDMESILFSVSGKKISNYLLKKHKSLTVSVCKKRINNLFTILV